MKSKWAVYKELELISDEVTDPRSLWPTVAAWMRHVWTVVQESIISRTTLQIWKKADGIGHTWWYVHDSTTGITHHFASEADVRVWLESRYYSPQPRPFLYGDGRVWH